VDHAFGGEEKKWKYHRMKMVKGGTTTLEEERERNPSNLCKSCPKEESYRWEKVGPLKRSCLFQGKGIFWRKKKRSEGPRS